MSIRWRRRRLRAIRAAPEERHFPALGRDIVAQDVKVAVDSPHFEVTVIGSQPVVNNFSDLDLGPRKPEASRRFLASVTCIALYVNRER
jgi:hypothetical protein